MIASCLCGEVKIEFGEPLGPFELCNCNRCKKHTGSAFNPVVDVSATDFKVVAGKDCIKSYIAPLLEREPRYKVWFCTNCGSPLPDPEPAGEVVEIPAGIIDGVLEVEPDKSIFSEQSFSWVERINKIRSFTSKEFIRYREKYGRTRCSRPDVD